MAIVKNPEFDVIGRVQHEYDLIERGLARQPDIERRPAFRNRVEEIRVRFRTL